MPCYIIRSGDTSFVKIGWADEDVEERRRALQTAHYELLTVLRVIDGPPTVERWMHSRFSQHRVRGEWFTFHDDMLTVQPLACIPAPIESAPTDPETLDAIEGFLARSGMTATGFGRAVAGDPTLVHELRKGRECRRVLRRKILAFIAASTSEEAA
jgi:2,4-dienoyl-CoA reductase-like NADH-dependent reductase (Old Yellow Enzyme family)